MTIGPFVVTPSTHTFDFHELCFYSGALSVLAKEDIDLIAELTSITAPEVESPLDLDLETATQICCKAGVIFGSNRPPPPTLNFHALCVFSAEMLSHQPWLKAEAAQLVPFSLQLRRRNIHELQHLVVLTSDEVDLLGTPFITLLESILGQTLSQVAAPLCSLGPPI